jgi:hypothetical protein
VAPLDSRGKLVEVRVRRSQVGGRVGDRDVGAAVEGVGGETATHPSAVDVRVAIVAPVPLRAALLSHAHHLSNHRTRLDAEALYCRALMAVRRRRFAVTL